MRGCEEVLRQKKSLKGKVFISTGVLFTLLEVRMSLFDSLFPYKGFSTLLHYIVVMFYFYLLFYKFINLLFINYSNIIKACCFTLPLLHKSITILEKRKPVSQQNIFLKYFILTLIIDIFRLSALFQQYGWPDQLEMNAASCNKTYKHILNHKTKIIFKSNIIIILCNISHLMCSEFYHRLI